MHRVLTNTTKNGGLKLGHELGITQKSGVAFDLPDSCRVGREARSGLSGRGG